MSSKSQYTLKLEQLLRDLKNTIEGVLSTQTANVWSIYGGLSRLHNLMEKIFKHGCIKSDTVNGTYYNFIQGLEWLQPGTSNCYFSIDCEYDPHIPIHLKGNSESIWLYRSLENLTLSTKIGWLLSDKNHLSSCYFPHAFLCNEEYSEALLICLKALERNQASLMSEINPHLFLLQPNATDIHKIHRRCSSFPEKINKNNMIVKNEEIKNKFKTIGTRHSVGDILNENLLSNENKINGKLKPWSSAPNLFIERMEVIKEILKSKTVPNTPIHSKKNIEVPKNKLPSKRCTFFVNNNSSMVNDNQSEIKIMSSPSSSVTYEHIVPFVINNNDIIEYTPPLSASYSSGTLLDSEDYGCLPFPKRKSSIHSPRSVIDYSFTSSFSALPGEKDFKKYPKTSFIEGGGKCVLPMSTGYFPKPTKGQSLLSFLTSSQLSQSSAEMDRENAHFRISEAIISALEQVKCKQDAKLCDEQMEDESDPEIQDLKQRIRVRRRQKMVEKQKRVWASSMMSDGRTDTTTSASPRSTTSDSYTDSSSSDDIDDIEIDEASNLLENKGLSISMASLYSEADIRRGRGAPDGASDIFSAESVAISLISKFKAKQLPKASDLEWLVSEEDAPQALLPLPKSLPVNPDDYENSTMPLRGTQDWAPPRPQIIFTLHPKASRKDLMTKQDYRCAGCSMRVTPRYASKYRYCEYLGRYFCTGCHSNQLALIPARILHKWDFTRYPVSTFSYRLLEQMYTDPLFRVFELNKTIGKIAKDLEFCQRYRTGLFYLKDFILTCKNAENIHGLVSPLADTTMEDTEMYSLKDLARIKSGDMKTHLKYFVEMCVNHVLACAICMGRGHICAVCGKNEVIFPWQMSLISRCGKCGSCYHKSCWNAIENPCKKCARITKRRESSSSSIQEV